MKYVLILFLLLQMVLISSVSSASFAKRYSYHYKINIKCKRTIGDACNIHTLTGERKGKTIENTCNNIRSFNKSQRRGKTGKTIEETFAEDLRRFRRFKCS